MPSGRGLKDSGLRRAHPTEANFSVIPCTTLLPWLLWYSSAVTILGREGGAVQVHSPSAGGRCFIPERMARPQIGPRGLRSKSAPKSFMRQGFCAARSERPVRHAGPTPLTAPATDCGGGSGIPELFLI